MTILVVQEAAPGPASLRGTSRAAMLAEEATPVKFFRRGIIPLWCGFADRG
jgi:hypothetical protein